MTLLDRVAKTILSLSLQHNHETQDLILPQTEKDSCKKRYERHYVGGTTPDTHNRLYGLRPRGGPAHKTKPCEARRYSARPARHWEDILRILRDLLGYVRSHDSYNLLLLFGYLLDLTDL